MTAVAGDAAIALHFGHGMAQVLRQILLQAGQLHGVAQGDDAADLGAAIDAGEIADRPLDFGHQIVEHRPHRLEHGLGILGLRGVLFEMLGLGEGELQLLGQRLGEVVAAQRNAPLPDAIAVGDHQVGRVGAQREDDHRLGRIVRIVFVRRRQVLQLVEDGVVVERQRRELHDVDFDAGLVERLQRANTWSRFMANRPTSVSSAKPSSSLPPAICW